MYACLYEHPEICMPRKEIHFFSRDRNWSRGFDWYEEIFAECPPTALAGEFSTSYLTDAEAPKRIRSRYPDARLIVSLRHPVDRAYSNYLNDLKGGDLPASTRFSDALASHPEYLDGSRYARHLREYMELFPREQIQVLWFHDARSDPLATVQQVYRFLGVDPDFRPSLLDRPVGAGRVPRSQLAERVLIHTAGAFRTRRSLRSIWWTAKRLGLGDRLRAVNSRGNGTAEANGLLPADRERLLDELEPEVAAVEQLLEVELPDWRR
jgi:hypothetical protein